MNIIVVVLVYHYNIIGVSAEKRARYVIVRTITKDLFALRTQQLKRQISYILYIWRSMINLKFWLDAFLGLQ